MVVGTLPEGVFMMMMSEYFTSQKCSKSRKLIRLARFLIGLHSILSNGKGVNISSVNDHLGEG